MRVIILSGHGDRAWWLPDELVLKSERGGGSVGKELVAGLESRSLLDVLKRLRMEGSQGKKTKNKIKHSPVK